VVVFMGNWRSDKNLILGAPACTWHCAGEHWRQWSRVDRLLGEHGIQQDTHTALQEFERRMEARRLDEADEAAPKVFRRGGCLGSEDLRRQILEPRDGKLGEHHSGELRRESAEAKAERSVAEEPARLGWHENQLATGRKSDPVNLAIAARRRAETTLWIKDLDPRGPLGTSRGANRGPTAHSQTLRNPLQAHRRFLPKPACHHHLAAMRFGPRPQRSLSFPPATDPLEANSSPGVEPLTAIGCGRNVWDY
jgi:hypothetical protein